ncbi:MAG: DUF4202 family protein [Deltaproteobacteria bacterium]|nr:DUF4202 family protein [Deltaproteobacteria bacterium]MBW1935722.1 DUF4202 family protein [Deltaproteobacteria bacterium]MBW1977673.1 DUF4202 family protein [Deltaproteobacteria bacterium]MBW2045402.1 DUF4202 family protein [Deltaproteobacteria bacterium]MBW2300220.1 DUF4202 family protein [Deltaproteobacteria bacterium]
MSAIDDLKEEIKETLSKSKVPEDYLHAQNTVEWLRKIKPDADEILIVAALGHDVERAIEERKVRREDFSDFDTFKEAHAQNSARILKEKMEKYPIGNAQKQRILRIVTRHETGGDPESDLIRDADALSFFDVNLPLYFRREGRERAMERSRWGYERLSPGIKDWVAGFTYDNEALNEIVRALSHDCKGESNTPKK